MNLKIAFFTTGADNYFSKEYSVHERSLDALRRALPKLGAELFDVDKSGISRHLKNIFQEGELDEEVVVAKIAIPTRHGALPGKEQNSPTN